LVIVKPPVLSANPQNCDMAAEITLIVPATTDRNSKIKLSEAYQNNRLFLHKLILRILPLPQRKIVGFVSVFVWPRPACRAQRRIMRPFCRVQQR